ncbi:hypothetical protein [Chryseobacterium taichungense]|uniref:hypothetical protein n=1 Tax=Chryseobacterium taichungense TaxID=295069 RepID=UPI0028A5B5E0|nr:hypothetical protein [Chryseobacterium taichungense]
MIVHFILSGETLESISEEINLENPKYLKEFHNKHCAREDFIHDDLIPRKKLLIPDINKIKEYNSRNDAPFKNPKLNPDIPFHPGNFSKIYSVVNKEIYENQLEKKHTILTYTVSVKWMRNENGFHIFHLFKNNFSDGQGNMMVDLASESIRSLNPLEVKTDLKGNVVSISLTQQTADNFAKIKKRLADLFPDQYANIYLNEFERAVQNRDIFNSRMKNDVFIKNYFAALRQPFENGKSFLQQTIGEENMTIQLQQKIENAEYNEEMVVLQTASMPENDLDFSGKYSLYKKTGLVKSVDISYAISQFGVKNSSFFTVTEMS